MIQLIGFFWQMMLLRRGPQDLPASMALLQLLLVLNLGLGFVLGLPFYAGPLQALGANLLELAFSAGVLYLGLRARGHASRWLQGYTALLGIGLIVALISMSYRMLAGVLAMPELAAILDLLLMMWLMVAMGNVVRESFDLPLAVGIVLVFAYTIVIFGLISHWFPPELAEAAAV